MTCCLSHIKPFASMKTLLHNNNIQNFALRQRTEENYWPTVGSGVGQIAQMEMALTCTAYARMSTYKKQQKNNKQTR